MVELANTVITQNLVSMYPINTQYYTVNLTVASWNSSTKSQTVSCAGISGDEDSQEIFISANATSGEDNLTAFDDAGVYVSGIAAGKITFTCFNVPTAAIKVDIAIQQVAAPPGEQGETWEIKENPRLFAGNTFNLSFTSNQQSFSKIVFEEISKFHTYLYYDDVEAADAFGSGVYVFNDVAYRTITFDSPVTDPKLLTWLQNNALKV